ncbi:hypothetical protein MA16_Dca028954 [Dendrobium catenatum]|uniref:Uncharacterized protein n=1 Tax=Dendrobium catenatum TaxID=906689 RepID=A0A2I0V7D6_9ASPA|nr:hypothetical protein MA16_Dca028954 [Dendrobium catenatum]
MVDLDSFISLSTAEDLDNMLNGYDFLLEASRCGHAKASSLPPPPSNRENTLAEFNDVTYIDNKMSYIEKVNGATKANTCKKHMGKTT